MWNHNFLLCSASHSSASRNMRSEACCDCTDERHLDAVSLATEITGSDGAEVAGTRGY